MLFFKSSKKKAKDLLSTAYKVYNYRCDTMSTSDASQMYSLIEKLEDLISEGKADSAEFVEVEKTLEPLMRKTGGNIYPLTIWTDYVDMIVVAGIVALAIRSFFLQPFKIPTNSMYPSFYGMTAEVYNDKNPAPTFPKRIFRKIVKSASNYSLVAKKDGALFLEINDPNSHSATAKGLFAFEWVDARDMFIIPTKARKYTFELSGKQHSITLPAEFPIEEVIMQAFPYSGTNNISEYLNKKLQDGEIVRLQNKLYMKLGTFKKNEQILNFDLLGGDMLFVDRFTYNFRKPKTGEPFVFMTKYCNGLTRLNGGVPDDKYYIKRLVGEGGDKLKISGSTLTINGKSAKGSVAFEANAKKSGKYCGYVADGSLAEGAEITIPKKSYWALGDNSANSLDSRYWGEVPEKSVVGKALIIFYPFTERWGATK